MSEIKRYSATGWNESSMKFEIDPDGHWIFYDDHVAIAQSLREELAEARSQLLELKRGLINNNTNFQLAFLDAYLDQFKKLKRERAEAQRLYHELLYAVGKKFPNETRHETALRYIKSCEDSFGETAMAAKDGGAGAEAND